MNQKNISAGAIILIIIGVLVVVGGVWYWQGQVEEPAACTQDAKLCPDGSYTSRTGPNCEFAACPKVEGETTDWKTYRNEEYGFEFKYPRNIVEVKESDHSETFWKEENYRFYILNKSYDYDYNYRPEFSVRVSTTGDESFEEWLDSQLSENTAGNIDNLLKEKFKTSNLDVLQILENIAPSGPADVIYHNFINRGNTVIDLKIRVITSSFGKEFPDKEFQKILSTFKFTK